MTGPDPEVQTARDIDLLVVGELNPDVLVLDHDPVPEFGQTEKVVSAVRLEIGSSSAIMACGAARLGLSVAFVGVVGDDAMGRFMLDALVERGVDVRHCVVDPALPTAVSVILSRGDDRAVLTSMGTIASLRAEMVPEELVTRARHVHAGSTAIIDPIRAGLPGILRAARAGGATTSFDPQGDPEGRWEGTDELLSIVDVALPNLAEARGMTGRDDPVDAARELIRRSSALRPAGAAPLTVAIKLGGGGAVAVRGDEVVRRPAPRMAVVDTTGAGDSFDAGFVAGSISGWPLDETLALAVACGSLSTRGLGGTSAQATIDEAVELIRASP